METGVGIYHALAVTPPVATWTVSRQRHACCSLPWRQVLRSRHQSSHLRPGTLALIAGITSFGVVATSTHRDKKRSLRAGATTTLLVDADVHQIHEIQSAIEELSSKGGPPSVTLFAAPERVDNKSWGRFLQKHHITFKPVDRVGGRIDPNDEAILAHVGHLLGQPGLKRLALLTSDTDFLELALQISARGLRTLVMIPEAMRGTIRKYTDAGIEVSRLRRRTGSVTYTVRATLHSDGTGTADRCKPIARLPDFREEVEDLLAFLTGLGYRSASGSRLLPCIAKCWFANSLGPLTVFPSQSAVMALHSAIKLPRYWTPNAHNLAFVFPCTVGKASKKKQLELGGTLAFRILQGGGPAMLHDSDRLPLQVLNRLGYLDNDLNADVHESLLVFVNSSLNKQLLRQMDALPNSGQQVDDICSSLRRIFLSSRGDGSWQLAPKDGLVRKLLVKSGDLAAMTANRTEVLRAMQVFSSKNMLPRMKTYNGFLWQIMRFANMDDPSRRDVIEF